MFKKFIPLLFLFFLAPSKAAKKKFIEFNVLGHDGKEADSFALDEVAKAKKCSYDEKTKVLKLFEDPSFLNLFKTKKKKKNFKALRGEHWRQIFNKLFYKSRLEIVCENVIHQKDNPAKPSKYGNLNLQFQSKSVKKKPFLLINQFKIYPKLGDSDEDSTSDKEKEESDSEYTKSFKSAEVLARPYKTYEMAKRDAVLLKMDKKRKKEKEKIEADEKQKAEYIKKRQEELKKEQEEKERIKKQKEMEEQEEQDRLNKQAALRAKQEKEIEPQIPIDFGRQETKPDSEIDIFEPETETGQNIDVFDLDEPTFFEPENENKEINLNTFQRDQDTLDVVAPKKEDGKKSKLLTIVPVGVLIGLIGLGLRFILKSKKTNNNEDE